MSAALGLLVLAVPLVTWWLLAPDRRTRLSLGSVLLVTALVLGLGVLGVVDVRGVPLLVLAYLLAGGVLSLLLSRGSRAPMLGVVLATVQVVVALLGALVLALVD